MSKTVTLTDPETGEQFEGRLHEGPVVPIVMLPEEVAEVVNVPPALMRAISRAGALKTVWISPRTLRYTPSEVQAWLLKALIRLDIAAEKVDDKNYIPLPAGLREALRDERDG